MKKLILISLVIVLSLGVNSCGKETSSTTNYTIYQVPVGIAATYVIMAFSNATTGINYQLEKAVGYTAMGVAAFDSTVTLKKTELGSCCEIHIRGHLHFCNYHQFSSENQFR